MAGIALKIQQPTGEVERHIDRADGAPAVEAAMCCDNGTKEIGHVGYAFLLSFSCNGLAAAALIGEHVHCGFLGPPLFVERGHADEGPKVLKFPHTVDVDKVVVVEGREPDLAVPFAEGVRS